MSTTIKWLVFSIGGLILIGLGLSITGEAIILKAAGNSWFVMGTLGLIAVNSGVSVFGQGVIYRIALNKERTS